VKQVLTTNEVRELLKSCGIPAPSKACVEIFAQEDHVSPQGTTFWEMRFDTEKIRRVVRRGVDHSEVISSIQDSMRRMEIEEPTPEMRCHLRKEWKKIFQTTL